MDTITLSLLVNNAPGVLQRICGLLGRRSYNIRSITVGVTSREDISRMTLVLDADEPLSEQIARQLAKLVDVLQIAHLHRQPMLARELMLVKLRAPAAVRPELLGIATAFRCPVVDVGHDSLVLQVVGDTGKNDALLQLVRRYGILELSRTGVTALARGDESLAVDEA